VIFTLNGVSKRIFDKVFKEEFLNYEIKKTRSKTEKMKTFLLFSSQVYIYTI